MIRRRFTKSVHCAGLRNSVCQKHWGVRFPPVRFRSSSGTSPASPASSASAPAKDADDASDAVDVAHAGEGNEGEKGGKDLNSERGEKILGRQRETNSGKRT